MTANILVFNCGSSSLNYKVYQTRDGSLHRLASGKAHHVATRSQAESFLENNFNGQNETITRHIGDHRQAASAVLDFLDVKDIRIDLIGHRFVHGGEYFQAAARVNAESLAKLERNLHLAPIHNPNSYNVIQLCSNRYPDTVQYMVFDTAFHASMPEKAYRYAIPYELGDRYGLRKYGFHGLSYQFICGKAAEILKQTLDELKIIACHLGSGGSSAAAILHGRSVQTSMGYSPLPGLVMSTRSGDIDAMVALDLIMQHGYSAEAVSRMLNKESGLLGVSGISSDIRELIPLVSQNRRAALAVEMYTNRLKEIIGSYAAVLGGADVLVFTDDIGVQSWQVREAACQGLAFMGVALDLERNQAAVPDRLCEVSAAQSTVRVLSIPTDEEWVIACEGIQFLNEL